MNGRDDLDPREARSLEELRRDASPSSGLEARVLDKLRDEGLMRRPRRLGPVLAWAALLAGVFVAGVLVGDRRGGPADRMDGDRYVLLLLEGPGYRSPETAEAERARVSEYAAWARDLAEGGRFVEGEKLDDPLHRVGEPAGTAEGGEALTGFFVIGAQSWEEALRIARTTPHVRYGGSVEVRRIGTAGS
ncbi:MAG: YciI family protein [Gemmatimonadota bacterium]